MNCTTILSISLFLVLQHNFIMCLLTGLWFVELNLWQLELLCEQCDQIGQNFAIWLNFFGGVYLQLDQFFFTLVSFFPRLFAFGPIFFKPFVFSGHTERKLNSYTCGSRSEVYKIFKLFHKNAITYIS